MQKQIQAADSSEHGKGQHFLDFVCLMVKGWENESSSLFSSGLRLKSLDSLHDMRLFTMGMQALSDLVQEYITEVSWLALSCDHSEEMAHIQCYKREQTVASHFATWRIAQEHPNLVLSDLSESFNISP